MRGMRKDWFILGAFAHLPDMRGDALLRQLTKSSRQQARSFIRSSCHCVRSTRRTLVLLLSRRCLCGILAVSLFLFEPVHRPRTKRRIANWDSLQNSALNYDRAAMNLHLHL